MNYRKATLLSRELATTAATKTLELEGLDVISRLQIRFEGINNGHTQTDHPAKCITKVEVVDGSDVLMSLTGQEIQALDFYDTGKPRPYEIDYRNDLPNQEVFNMNFGRFLYDTMLAFDPGRFKHPQLKITHDRTLGGSAPDAAYLTVWADLFDEKVISPQGWLMAKEFFSYTPTASAYKDIELPSDYALRQLLIRAQVAGYSFTDHVDEIRIDENNLKRVPVDLNMFIYMCQIMGHYPLYEELISWWAAAAGTPSLYITPCEYAYVALGQVGAITAYLASEGCGGKTTVTTDSAEVFRSIVKGYMPHGCLPVPFGDQQNLADWYDITRIAKLTLRLHHPATVGGTCQIITQQLRKY